MDPTTQKEAHRRLAKLGTYNAPFQLLRRNLDRAGIAHKIPAVLPNEKPASPPAE